MVQDEISPQSPPIYLGVNFPGIDIAGGRNLGFRVMTGESNNREDEDEEAEEEDAEEEDPIEAQLVYEKLRSNLGLNDGEDIAHCVPHTRGASSSNNTNKQLRPPPPSPPNTPSLVQWYRATIPSPRSATGAQLWTRFLRRPVLHPFVSSCVATNDDAQVKQKGRQFSFIQRQLILFSSKQHQIFVHVLQIKIKRSKLCQTLPPK